MSGTVVLTRWDGLGILAVWEDRDEPPDVTPGQTKPDPNDPDFSTNYSIIGRSGAAYDNLGRVYQTSSYNPSGTVATVSNTFYDPDGNILETQEGGTQEFTKTSYDGLDQPTVVYDGYDPSGNPSTDATAGNVLGDVILNQTDTQYDAAGDVTLVTSLDSYNDALTAAGALSSSDSPSFLHGVLV